MCGSLWHNPRTGHSFKTDKYHGRELDISEFEEEILNFKQICPLEMLDKIDNPITLKNIVKKVS